MITSAVTTSPTTTAVLLWPFTGVLSGLSGSPDVVVTPAGVVLEPSGDVPLAGDVTLVVATKGGGVDNPGTGVGFPEASEGGAVGASVLVPLLVGAAVV